MSELTDFLLADCPTHGRVQHLYRLAPNAWVCRLYGSNDCRHFVPDEERCTR